MPTYDRGDVIIVLYPFTDGVGRKPRPAVVVSSQVLNNGSPDVIVALITSNIRGSPGIGDYDLPDWAQYGLLAPSRVRASRVAAVELTKVRKHLGTMSEGDQKQVDDCLRQVFGI